MTTDRWRATARCLKCHALQPVIRVQSAVPNGFNVGQPPVWRPLPGLTAQVTLACGDRATVVTSDANLAAMRGERG